MYKLFVIALGVCLLAACGAETAGAAATGAVIKKQEIEQGQKTMEQMKQKIDESMQQMQQNTRSAAD